MLQELNESDTEYFKEHSSVIEGALCKVFAEFKHGFLIHRAWFQCLQVIDSVVIIFKHRLSRKLHIANISQQC